MYIIVINNGRDKILKQLEQQQALHCIHCNACKYHCPVWQTIGEKSYQTPYSGPIGAVVMPLLRDTAKYSFLTYSAGISEKIQQHCPVKIPINELILYNRALFVKESSNDKSFLLNFMVKKSLLFFCDRNIMNTSSRRKTNFLRFVTRKQPYVRFSIPPFAKKTFNELYKEQLLND
jgi:L-lactate dehydrogenase complex protein LldF